MFSNLAHRDSSELPLNNVSNYKTETTLGLNSFNAK